MENTNPDTVLLIIQADMVNKMIIYLPDKNNITIISFKIFFNDLSVI